MRKPPSRSPTHLDVDVGRLAALGLELEDLAVDGRVALGQLVELAEERGKPASHYLAALALCEELQLDRGAATATVTVCAGSCQQWGALDVLEHLAARCDRDATLAIVPVSCLDRCDRAASCRIEGPAGAVFVDQATAAAVDSALATVSSLD